MLKFSGNTNPPKTTPLTFNNHWVGLKTRFILHKALKHSQPVFLKEISHPLTPVRKKTETFARNLNSLKSSPIECRVHAFHSFSLLSTYFLQICPTPLHSKTCPPVTSLTKHLKTHFSKLNFPSILPHFNIHNPGLLPSSVPWLWIFPLLLLV